MGEAVGVIGLGFIGLPLALSYCEKGFQVMGVDIDVSKVEHLKRGETQVQEPCNGLPLDVILRVHLQAGTFRPSTRMTVAAWECTSYIVTVGIPVSSSGQLDEMPLLTAMQQLGKVIKPNDLVLLRSTVVPGMIEEKILPLLYQTSRLLPGVDFHFAYAAERVAEGRAMEEFKTLDVVMGGVTPQCSARASDLLSRLTDGTIHVTDLRTAQIVKVIENAQRDVNIALVQEIAQCAEHHAIDVYELIRLANTHPRVQLLQPGIGVGGYCIPNAFSYLRHSLGAIDSLPLFDTARSVNRDVPKRIVERLAGGLEQSRKSIEGSTVAVLGLGMKENSNDIRQSPAIALVELLLQRGAVVRAYDPLVSIQLPYQTKTLKECLYGADGLVVAVWHQVFEEMDMTKAILASHVQGAVVDLKQKLQKYSFLMTPERVFSSTR